MLPTDGSGFEGSFFKMLTRLKGSHARKVPVIGFEDEQDVNVLEHNVPEGLLDWVAASNIRPFRAVGPDNNPVQGFDTANSYVE